MLVLGTHRTSVKRAYREPFTGWPLVRDIIEVWLVDKGNEMELRMAKSSETDSTISLGT